jgi:hypothetical protein
VIARYAQEEANKNEMSFGGASLIGRKTDLGDRLTGSFESAAWMDFDVIFRIRVGWSDGHGGDGGHEGLTSHAHLSIVDQ